MAHDNFPQAVLSLPIGPHLEKIASGVRQHPLSILQSSPGSGKTTLLPIFLAQQDWLKDKKILVLQPRRLAAKSVAIRMATLLNESVGETVGYQIRLEQRRTPRTRIEVITEGLLTRRLVADPELSDVGLVIFDEFHERSAHADIGLALAREVISVLRPDLRVVVMSATLHSLLDHSLFASAWSYSFDSTPFPVEVRYLLPEPRKPVWDETSRIIRSALLQHPGDLLAFLPGRYEIEKCANSLIATNVEVDVVPLFGELAFEEQQRAIEPNKSGRRKVVLATPIAETSLTIEGVRIVVDAGLHKVARSDATGEVSLSTERITRDSADQRAGRAGRTAPGVCLRLWSEQEHKTLRAAREPEILRTDITPLLLDLFAWGIRNPRDFSWITAPSLHAIDSAIEVLRGLKAIRPDGTVTERGLLLASLGTHPRIAGMCLEARTYGLERQAAAIIPLLEERVVGSAHDFGADMLKSVDSLQDSSRRRSGRLQELYSYWLKRIEGMPPESDKRAWQFSDDDSLGYLLAVGFPDRIARRRESQAERYILASGRGATLRARHPLAAHEYLVVASLQHREDDGAILLAAPLNPRLFESLLADRVSKELQASFDQARGVLVASSVYRIGAITLREERKHNLTTDELCEALTSYLRSTSGHDQLPFSARARTLQARSAWLRTTHSRHTIPDISNDALRCSEPFWLSKVLPKSGRLSDLTSTNLDEALHALFSWTETSLLQKLAPEFITLPNGKNRPIDYSQADAPAVEAMIQELFGLSATPVIGEFATPVTLRLLSPARRPMQVTRDLASFWRNGYPEVRKELRGRYPKHRWPEDPLKRNE